MSYHPHPILGGGAHPCLQLAPPEPARRHRSQQQTQELEEGATDELAPSESRDAES